MSEVKGEAKPLRTSLTDLHEILFLQLERVSDEDLSDEELNKEIKRGQAISNLAAQIIQNGNLAIKALTSKLDVPGNETLPKFLDVGRPEKCTGPQKR